MSFKVQPSMLQDVVREHLRSCRRYAIVSASIASACALSPVLGGAALAQSAPATEETLEYVTVTGHAEFFRPTEASSATKFDLSVQDTPQAIAVLTDDILQTFGASELFDISKFVAGVQSSPSSQNANFFLGQIQARGFKLDGQSGFKINGFSTLREFQPDLVAVERVEFLKGPSSVLYGVNSYGGLINTVLKKPEESPGYSLQLTGGSYDYYRIEADATGPITDSGALRYRVASAYQTNHSITRGSDFERVPVFGQIEYQLGDSTVLDFYGLYQRERAVPNFGLAATLDAQGNYSEPFDVPRELFPADADVNDLRRDSYQLFGGVRHRLANDYRVEIKAGHTRNELEYRAQYVYNYGFAAAPFADIYYGTNDRTTHSSDVELTFGGDFAAFDHENTFIVAAEYRHIVQDAVDFAFDNLGAVDMLAADFSTLDPPRAIVNETIGGTLQEEDRYAIAAQVLLRPIDRWSVLLGGRYDKVEKDFNQQRHDPDPDDDVVVFDIDVQSKQSLTEFTPRAGLVFEVAPQINAFYSFTRGFIPQDGVTRSLRDIGPETGTQHEIGLKGEFREGRLGASLALFSIERENVAVSDPQNAPGESFLIDGREQEHKGIELEVIGQPWDNFNMIATFSYLDAEVTRAVDEVPDDDVPSDVGLRIQGAPKHSGSLYAQYEIAAGALKGLAFGAGATYVGERLSQETRVLAAFEPGAGWTPFNFRSYTTFDASLRYYGFDRIVIGLDVNNLADEDYFEYGASCCGGNHLQRGNPREYRGFVSLEF